MDEARAMRRSVQKQRSSIRIRGCVNRLVPYCTPIHRWRDRKIPVSPPFVSNTINMIWCDIPMIRVGRVVRPSRMKLHRSRNGDQKKLSTVCAVSTIATMFKHTADGSHVKKKLRSKICEDHRWIRCICHCGCQVLYIAHWSCTVPDGLLFSFWPSAISTLPLAISTSSSTKSFLTIIGSGVADIFLCWKNKEPIFRWRWKIKMNSFGQ